MLCINRCIYNALRSSEHKNLCTDRASIEVIPMQLIFRFVFIARNEILHTALNSQSFQDELQNEKRRASKILRIGLTTELVSTLQNGES